MRFSCDLVNLSFVYGLFVLFSWVVFCYKFE